MAAVVHSELTNLNTAAWMGASQSCLGLAIQFRMGRIVSKIIL
jgi:hypothetical protein